MNYYGIWEMVGALWTDSVDKPVSQLIIFLLPTFKLACDLRIFSPPSLITAYGRRKGTENF